MPKCWTRWVSHAVAAVTLPVLLGGIVPDALGQSDLGRLSRLSGGAVEYRGQRYNSIEAFHRSTAFAADGLRCGVDSAMASRAPELAEAVDPVVQQRVQDCTNSLTVISSEYAPIDGVTYTIPVWFHVIYNSSNEGFITDQRIADQIAVMNEDYAGIAGATGANTTIQFTLAGVTRTQNNTWFTTSDESLYKSALAVDTSRYLNVYTKDLSNGLLGYAYLPSGAAGTIIDGIVMLHDTIGGRNNGYSVFDQGRTLVHEVGHYLGLYHTFQSNGGSCLNSYTQGDLITDTPPQSFPDYACSAGTSCGNPSALENFMNYSYDRCMDAFTLEQANRMICSLTSYRPNTFTEGGDGGGPVAPVAVNDSATMNEDGPDLDIDVVANDTDADGTIAANTVSITGQPSDGSVINNGDGTVTYAVDTNFNGTDSFTYTVQDNDGQGSNAATVTITVNAVNDPPVAVGDSASTVEDVATLIAVTNNDTDIDGSVDGATVAVVAAPANGTAVSNGSGGITYTPAPDFNGDDSFTYRVRDNGGALSNTATVSVSVAAVNDPPLAVADSAALNEDSGSVVINLVGNDLDPDGTVVASSVVITGQPSNGAVVNTGNGNVTYTPANQFNGTDSFTYTVQDNNGQVSNGATVTVTVNDINDLPVAVGDSATTNENQPRTINVIANDSDIDGFIDPASVTLVSTSDNGAVLVNGDGTVTYTPNPDYNGTDAFSYRVLDDDGGQSNTAAVTINVAVVDDPPVANADSVSLAEDGGGVTINLIGNDTDDDQVAEDSVEIVSSPVSGSLVINPNGSVRYTPALNFAGNDSFTYTVRDISGQTSNVATVSITVTPVNDPPVAVNDAASTAEDAPVLLIILSNDTDVDGSIDLSSLAIIAGPSSGAAALQANGAVLYTPTANFNGVDSFTYRVRDNAGSLSNTATVSITVNAVNDVPVANSDALSVAEDSSGATVNLLANDTDVENALAAASVVVTSQPAHGAVAVNSQGVATYTPDADYSGADSFSYTVQDAVGATSNVATVSITVIEANDPPQASGDAVTTIEDVPVVFNVTRNDEDVDGVINTLSLQIASAPQHGSALSNGDGSVTYTPAANYFGADSFTYTVRDDGGLLSNAATVSVTVDPDNDAPVAVNDTPTTNEDELQTINLTVNDTDVENGLDPSTVAFTSAPSHGEVLNNGDGTVDYRPANDFYGTDQFDYTVADVDGKRSNVARVTITVVPVNDPPVTRALSISTPEDTAVNVDVIAGASDGDSELDPATLAISTAPSHGSAVANGNGTVTYTPSTNYFGADSFAYTVQDQAGATSAPATVNITVNAVADAPIARDDSALLDDEAPVLVSLLSNDTDPDGPLAGAIVVITSGPATGVVVNNGDGTVTYTPAANFIESDSFNYRVRDASGLLSNTASVTIDEYLSQLPMWLLFEAHLRAQQQGQ